MDGFGIAIAEEAEVGAETIAPATSAAPDPVAVVRAVLALPDEELDYARAKLAFDAAIDPSVDTEAVLAELDRMAWLARRMAGPGADSARKLDALRALIYKSGPWNRFRPFDYDFDNFKDLRVKLLSRYLETRLGNCVTMPILFLILGDKIGLHLSLAVAPVHLYLRHRDESGHTISLEPTSGALFARECWVRQTRQVTDRGIESGLYMRSLSRREGIATMALTVIEYLMAERRFAEAIAVTEIILALNPRDGIAWAHQGQAYHRMIGAEFLDKYGSKYLIPALERGRYMMLLHRNHAAFAISHSLGWEPVQVTQAQIEEARRYSQSCKTKSAVT